MVQKYYKSVNLLILMFIVLSIPARAQVRAQAQAQAQALIPKWTVDVGLDSEGKRFPFTSRWGWTNSLTTSGDQILLGSTGNLICLQRATGKIQWQLKTEAGCHLKPVVDASTVFFLTTQNDKGLLASLGTTSETGVLYAVERSSGQVLWKRDFKIDGGLASMAGAEPLVDNGKLYLGWGKTGLFVSANGHILCLETKTGATLWEKDLPFGLHPKLQGNLLVSGFRKELICLDKISGETKWKAKIDNITKGEILVYKNIVVVGGGSESENSTAQTSSWGNVYGFDLNSGTRIWNFDMGHPNDFALIGNSLLVRRSGFFSSAQLLLNVQTGTSEWEGDVIGNVTRFAEPQGVLFEKKEKLIWFNPTTRKIVKTQQVDWIVTQSIQKQGNGIAFLVVSPPPRQNGTHNNYTIDLLVSSNDGAELKTSYSIFSKRDNPFLVIEGEEALLSSGDGKVVSLEMKPLAPSRQE